MLTSELKGTINNPAWYFNEEEKAWQAADLLMLTHGWRKYYIEQALQGNMKKPTIKVESSQAVSGTITNRRGKREAAGLVKVTALAYGLVGVVQANDDGYFYMNNFEHPDSTAFHLFGKSNSNGQEERRKTAV